MSCRKRITVTVNQDFILNDKIVNLSKDGEDTLSITKPEDVSGENINWISLNPDIVEIAPDGDGHYTYTGENDTKNNVTGKSVKLKAKKEGQTAIEAQYCPSGSEDTVKQTYCLITVSGEAEEPSKEPSDVEQTPDEQEVTSITMLAGTTSVYTGQTISLSAILAPTTSTAPITWSTDKESVATVKASEDGKTATVTGISTGTATITATTGDKTASVEITVKRRTSSGGGTGTGSGSTPSKNPSVAPSMEPSSSTSEVSGSASESVSTSGSDTSVSGSSESGTSESGSSEISGSESGSSDERPAEPSDEEPSIEPSVEPSVEPTLAPSEEPSKEPTLAPSEEPSKEPTLAPSEEPSKEPTLAPSEEPSKEPSTAPSEEPSKEPSTAPSEEPSDAPSEAPSTKPSGPSTIDTTTETKEDGTTVTTETKDDGSKVITEEKPDGSTTKTEISADGTMNKVENKADGTTIETNENPDGSKEISEERPDGSYKKTETKTDGSSVMNEKKADGTTVKRVTTASGAATETVKATETNKSGKKVAVTEVTKTDKKGKVTSKVETSVIEKIEKNATATITVKTDSKGKVTATASVKKPGSTSKSGTKGTISAAVVTQVQEAAGSKKVQISQAVTDKKGKTAYTLKANAADLKKGKTLTVVKVDPKTGKQTLVNATNYKVSAGGNVSATFKTKGTYQFLNASDTKKVEKAVLKTVASKKTSTTLKKNKETKMTFSSKLDMANVKTITYKSGKSSVATVSKNGKIKCKDSGNCHIKERKEEDCYHDGKN
ncbi:MAG: Ig-like domain-containing protein [Lachnospiraceae bacterium]